MRLVSIERSEGVFPEVPRTVLISAFRAKHPGPVIEPSIGLVLVYFLIQTAEVILLEMYRFVHRPKFLADSLGAHLILFFHAVLLFDALQIGLQIFGVLPAVKRIN